MSSVRRIARVERTPPPAPGFIGEGHTAVEVVRPDALVASDPFVLLMDDRLDIEQRRQIGGAHPHAGIETVTLILEGSIVDRDEGELSAGDVVWMNAGRGIIHNEAVEVEGRSRVLQLWIRLPARDRTIAPSFEIVHGKDAPVHRAAGVTARLYSGATGDLTSPTKNRAPITLVDVTLEPGARFSQRLPQRYNGFLYVVDGDLEASGTGLSLADVAWLDRPDGNGEDALALVAGDRGARVVIYAGEPQREPLVHYGPFVGGTMADIQASAASYHRGEFTSMSALTRASAGTSSRTASAARR